MLGYRLSGLSEKVPRKTPRNNVIHLSIGCGKESVLGYLEPPNTRIGNMVWLCSVILCFFFSVFPKLCLGSFNGLLQREFTCRHMHNLLLSLDNKRRHLPDFPLRRNDKDPPLKGSYSVRWVVPPPICLKRNELHYAPHPPLLYPKESGLTCQPVPDAPIPKKMGLCFPTPIPLGPNKLRFALHLPPPPLYIPGCSPWSLWARAQILGYREDGSELSSQTYRNKTRFVGTHSRIPLIRCVKNCHMPGAWMTAVQLTPSKLYKDLKYINNS